MFGRQQTQSFWWHAGYSHKDALSEESSNSISATIAFCSADDANTAWRGHTTAPRFRACLQTLS